MADDIINQLLPAIMQDQTQGQLPLPPRFMSPEERRRRAAAIPPETGQPTVSMPPPGARTEQPSQLNAPPPLPLIPDAMRPSVPQPTDGGVMPGAPPALAPRMTGGVSVQSPNGGPAMPINSDQSFSLGAGAPTLLPTTGSERVAPDPEWRRKWDEQAARDNQSLFLRALGGTAYGSGGSIPTMAQARSANSDMTPEMYTRLVGMEMQNRASQGDLGLRTAMQLNPETASYQSVTQPHHTQQESLAAANIRGMIQNHMDTHPGATMGQAYEAIARDTGTTVDRIRQLHINSSTTGSVTGASLAPRGLSGVQGAFPGGNAAPVGLLGPTAGGGRENSPEPAMTAQDAFDRYVSQYAPQSPPTREGTAGPRLASNFANLQDDDRANHVRDFINGLPAGLAEREIHNLMPILRTQFGQSDKAMRTIMGGHYAGIGEEGANERAMNRVAQAMIARNPRSIYPTRDLLGRGGYSSLPTNTDELLAPGADRGLRPSGVNQLDPGLLGVNAGWRNIMGPVFNALGLKDPGV